MPPSEAEKIFRAFAEERKRALPQFTPDGIPITLENKFDDAMYNYLYAYWKEQSGEYDPKKDVIPESEMNKMHPKTKNEFQFENWLFEQYGMTKKEERGYTVKGNLESLWEIFSAADMVLFARGLPSIGKELAQLGKKAVDDVAEEAIEKTVKTEVTEEVAESTAKKEMADTAEDLSQKTVNKDDALKDSSIIKKGSGTLKNGTYTNLDDGLNFSNKALEHMGESARQVPVQTLQDAIRHGQAMPDPRGSNATMYYTTMYKNGKMYNLEVLYDETTNTVYHFEYARKAMGNLPAIPK